MSVLKFFKQENEDSGLRYDTVAMSNWIPTFQGNTMSSSSRKKRPRSIPGPTNPHTIPEFTCRD